MGCVVYGVVGFEVRVWAADGSRGGLWCQLGGSLGATLGSLRRCRVSAVCVCCVCFTEHHLIQK
jgi:hypothetical protein